MKFKINFLPKLFLIMSCIFISLVVLNHSYSYNRIEQPVIEFTGSPEIDFISLLGGTYEEPAYSMVLDDLHNIYIAGWTNSPDFPTTIHAYNPNRSTCTYDIYVAKISADGSTLLFSTLICGTYDSYPYHGSPPSIGLDSFGNVIVVGSTSSDDFETTAGAINITRIGQRDIIIAKISADGSELLYGTYFGGSDEDAVRDLVIDDEDNIILLGHTESTDFMTTPGAYQRTHSGPSPEGLDLFIAKIHANGSLAYSTLFGGNGNDGFASFALDSQGNVIVAGDSTSADLFTTSDALYPSTIGGSGVKIGKYLLDVDGFVAKFSADGSEVLYSTYIGGSSNEWIGSMTLDSADNIIIGGSSISTNFPTTKGAYQPINGDVTSIFGDMFITKIAADGSSILYSTFVDGSDGSFYCRDICLDKDNNIYFTGTGHTHVLSADMSTMLYKNSTSPPITNAFGGYSIELIETQDNIAFYVVGSATTTSSLFAGPNVTWLSPNQNHAVFIVKLDWAISRTQSNTSSIETTDLSTTTTSEVKTTGFDFLIIGMLVITSGMIYFKRKGKNH
jgi:hypothetical protein